ncbi:MAG: hypothetical protein R2729_16525 [Bryobacteraceae bacterium]
MPEVIVATPLKTVSRPYSFGEGISIRELTEIRWDSATVKNVIAEQEREELRETKFWLVAAKEYDTAFGSNSDELYDLAWIAAMSLQIICPTGAHHVFLKFQTRQDGWDNIGSRNPKRLCSTLLGRLAGASLEDQGLTQRFAAIYQGIRRAQEDKLVRIQNPVFLLEHGQQIGNPVLGTLFFVMGLDVLFMAGESSTFMERIGGFMGLDTLLFPPDAYLHRQPSIDVRQILRDLYDLRNIIAHGQEIPKTPYREPYPIMSTTGEQINRETLGYADILLEASLFLPNRRPPKAVHRRTL